MVHNFVWPESGHGWPLDHNLVKDVVMRLLRQGFPDFKNLSGYGVDVKVTGFAMNGEVKFIPNSDEGKTFLDLNEGKLFELLKTLR